MMTSTPRTSDLARTCRNVILAIIAAAAFASAMSACSTTEGFGTDVKNLGDNIEDSAARNK